MKKILVTGGAGFIGSNTTKLLCDKGFQVIVFDNLSMGYRQLVDKRAKFVKGDLQNLVEIEKVMRGVNYVFHFAATSIIKHTLEDPLNCYKNNLNGTVNLLEAMRKHGVKQLVNSSSASVYGEPESIPVKEDSRKEPLTPYGSSKLAVEIIASSYFRAYGINSTSLRYFNAYGPCDEQQPITRAVPNWIKQVLNNQPISLYWKGKQLRDYVFVEDIARAHLAVMDLSGYNYFNIGSGKGIFMIDLLEGIFKAIGKQTPITDLGERPGDPMNLVADTTKIEKAISWKPSFSLDKGIKLTVDYFKNSRFKMIIFGTHL